MDSKKDSLSAVAPSLLAGLGAGNVDVSPENWFTGADPLTSGTAVDPPPAKKQKLSLSLSRNRPLKDKTNQDGKRFASPVKTSEFEQARRGVIPQNTKQSTSWATRVFRAWAEERNARISDPDDVIPSDILQSRDRESVCRVMSYFSLEVRREDGERYNPGTVRSLLCGLNRAMKEYGAPFSILDKGDSAFRDLQHTLDTITSALHRDGIGATKNSAAVITREHEALFWDKRFLDALIPRCCRGQ